MVRMLLDEQLVDERAYVRRRGEAWNEMVLVRLQISLHDDDILRPSTLSNEQTWNNPRARDVKSSTLCAFTSQRVSSLSTLSTLNNGHKVEKPRVHLLTPC